jgi:hypothetical protein
MVRYLYGRISANQWLGSEVSKRTNSPTGVLLRQSRGHYVTAPGDVSDLLLSAVCKINAEVAFTMCTETVDVVLSSLEPFQTGSQLQIMDSLSDIAQNTIKKFQYACLVRQERMLLVWHDDLQHIIPHASRMEETLLSLVSTLAHPISDASVDRAVGLGILATSIQEPARYAAHYHRRHSEYISLQLQPGGEEDSECRSGRDGLTRRRERLHKSRVAGTSYELYFCSLCGYGHLLDYSHAARFGHVESDLGEPH